MIEPLIPVLASMVPALARTTAQAVERWLLARKHEDLRLVHVYTSDTEAGEALVKAIEELAEQCDAEETKHTEPIYGSLRQWVVARFQRKAASEKFDAYMAALARSLETKAVEKERAQLAALEAQTLMAMSSAVAATPDAAIMTEKLLLVKSGECTVAKPITEAERKFLMENHDLLSKPATLLEMMQVAPSLTTAPELIEGDAS
ncbi:hypothetical protein LO763_22925 [Glycomyces sp. A-F 0318]|uniref:hypothetical protein n=1 Tax=Glycomyces amatae TaxID=2881355 RepID=UPI001E4208F4|nr:hypothetical protein [Glycomyces amatae]MCD0446474.1 hypothetical protein [Glycomyces amatae]